MKVFSGATLMQRNSRLLIASKGTSRVWGSKKSFLINVYAKCDLESKRRLWDSFLEIRREIWEIGLSVFLET